MSKHLKYLIEGARQVLVLFPADGYVQPSRSDFKKDIKTLRKDAHKVIADLSITTRKYGK